MHPCLKVVTRRFPQVGEQVVRLFERDEDFHDVCLEYQVCQESVERLEASGPSAEGLRNEYAALLLRLERELLRHLEEHPKA